MNPLIDPSGRQVDYLRISVTDRCNERCLYCLTESHSGWLPRAEVLRDEELMAIVKAAVSLGFTRFRVTGGEPLLRKGIVDLIGDIVRLPGVESVMLTTNGLLLPALAQPLYDAGLRRINISLDALNAATYRAITGGDVGPVLRGIELVRKIGFPSVKLNTVLMRGKNESEILSLLYYAASLDIAIRFIELMPVSSTEMLQDNIFLPIKEVRTLLQQHGTLVPLDEHLGFGPAKYFRLSELGATVGLIGAMSDLHFCDRCNKMRLTSDGKLRPCLGNHLETGLMPALRPAVNHQALQKLFLNTLAEKPEEHSFRQQFVPLRGMTAIGG
jgi:cyclic pyranopterin phosphate synthase